jgi:hypothetical protein
MSLNDILGGAALDFTLPALGGVVPDDGCSCNVGGSGCDGMSSCTNYAGESCPDGQSTCSENACKSSVDSNSGSCDGADTCGSAICDTQRGF